MKRYYDIVRAVVVAGMLCFVPAHIMAQKSYDSLNVDLPKHYFNTLISVDGYRKPNRKFRDTSTALSRRLRSYGIKQFSASFYTPLVTNSWKGPDSVTIRNTHLFLTGNFMSLRPVFDGLKEHNLVKVGVGIRYIYNTGKKGVWFFDVAPFLTRDVTFRSRAYIRLASTAVYSHNASARFNFRVGITKSFLWGNRFYLPFLGIRVGRLDKINLSIQFPRCINFNIPVSSKAVLSLYTRPQGGMFNFSNADSLYFRRTDATFHFTRYEILTGFRFDFRAGNNFDLFVSTGISSKNNITFYSERANKDRARLPYLRHFYTMDVAPTLFFNAGFIVRFGKTRSYYNDKNIYDAMDLNNTMDPNGNLPIPLRPERKHRDSNLEDIRDLVDYNDF